MQDGTTLLREFFHNHKPVFVLTGAGCSTESGLGDYRDKNGDWKRTQPITGSTFINDESARKRYWARSTVGWPQFSTAKPNAAHEGLKALDQLGYLSQLVTQNVDGLHQRAGHRNVVDLHGVLATVSCVSCDHTVDRNLLQKWLLQRNPYLQGFVDKQKPTLAPDGDTDIETELFDYLSIPACPQCGDILKPDVVFFGDNVPKARVTSALSELKKSGSLLVVGSSLMVYSGYRFCKAASEAGQPIALLNHGRTRADDIASLKIEANCSSTLSKLATALGLNHN